VGEFNADADQDLAVANEGSNVVSVLLVGTGVSFMAPTNFGVCSAPTALVVGEFNADADPDLAVVNELCHNVSVLLGSTGGSFTGSTDFATGNLPDSVAVGEFNHDLDPDLATANQGSDNVSVLVGGAWANFRGPINFAAGDFNGDTDPDLAVTNEISNNVSILLATSTDGYPRPKGATPVLLPLVLAYGACAPSGANRTHGPALSQPSCNPPVQSSGYVTVGTLDANSNSAQFVRLAQVHVLRQRHLRHAKRARP
jgi:predicted NUDIX family NTP pyrophosphohydrolase